MRGRKEQIERRGRTLFLNQTSTANNILSTLNTKNNNDHQNRRRSYKSATAPLKPRTYSAKAALTSDHDPLQLTSRPQEGKAAIMAGPDSSSSYFSVNKFKTQSQADMKGTLTTRTGDDPINQRQHH